MQRYYLARRSHPSQVELIGSVSFSSTILNERRRERKNLTPSFQLRRMIPQSFTCPTKLLQPQRQISRASPELSYVSNPPAKPMRQPRPALCFVGQPRQALFFVHQTQTGTSSASTNQTGNMFRGLPERFLCFFAVSFLNRDFPCRVFAISDA